MAVLQGCRTLPLFFCLEKLTLNDKVDIDVCLQMHVNGSMEKTYEGTYKHCETQTTIGWISKITRTWKIFNK